MNTNIRFPPKHVLIQLLFLFMPTAMRDLGLGRPRLVILLTYLGDIALQVCANTGAPVQRLRMVYRKNT